VQAAVLVSELHRPSEHGPVTGTRGPRP
jgi:hypothetical protein